MDSLGKALEWIGNNVQVLGKSDSNLNTSGPSPAGRRRCESYNSRPTEKVNEDDVASNMNQDNGCLHRDDGRTILSKKGIDYRIDDTSNKRKTKADGLKIENPSSCSIYSSLTDNNDEKQSSYESNKPVSPFEYKTLVVIPVIPNLPGAKVAEIKPNPAWSVEPPVTLGIVRSSTTRLNEISPPCAGETAKAGEGIKNPVDILNRRRLKEKSESFTGIENFRQKRPNVFKRTNSAALIKVPETSTAYHSSLLAPNNHIRKTLSDSGALQDTDYRSIVPVNRLASTDSKSYLSVGSSTPGTRDSEDKSGFESEVNNRTSVSSYSSLRKSDTRLQIDRPSIEYKNKSTNNSTGSRRPSVFTLTGSRISSSGVGGRSVPPCFKTDESEHSFGFYYDIISETETHPRKIDAIIKAFKYKTTNTGSRLSLFSLKNDKRFKRDKIYRQDLLDEVAAARTPQIKSCKTNNDTDECMKDVNATETTIEQNVTISKQDMLKKQMSFSEHQMRSAQLELFKKYVSETDSEAVCDLGRIQFIVYFLNSSHTLRVSDLKATGLHRPQNCAKSTQLFATICLKSDKRKKVTSKKVAFTDKPEFHEDFDFRHFSLRPEQDVRLKITIYRKDALFSLPKFIGRTYTALADCDLHVGKPIWRTLRPKTGKVSHLS